MACECADTAHAMRRKVYTKAENMYIKMQKGVSYDNH